MPRSSSRSTPTSAWARPATPRPPRVGDELDLRQPDPVRPRHGVPRPDQVRRRRRGSTSSWPSAASAATPRCSTTWEAGRHRLDLSPVVPVGDHDQAAAAEAYDLLAQQRTGAIIFMVLADAGRLPRGAAGRPDDQPADPRRRRRGHRVAAGDLTARITTTAAGEAGQLLRAVDTMTQDLRSLIGRIQQSSITLMSTATEISATSRQQGEAVSDYGASTSEAAAAVKQISATSLELLRTMNEVNHVASQTREHGQRRPGEPGRDGPVDAAARRVDHVDRLEAVGHQRAGRAHQPGRDHDRQGRRPDQPALDQRGHRGREGRRIRPRLPGRRPRDPPPGRPDRRGHARHRADGQGDAVQRLRRRHGDGQVQRPGPPGGRRGRRDRRPARRDHRRRAGLDRAVRPGQRGDAGAVAGGRADPRGGHPPERRGPPDLDLAPRVQPGHRPPPRRRRRSQGGGFPVHRRLSAHDNR